MFKKLKNFIYCVVVFFVFFSQSFSCFQSSRFNHCLAPQVQLQKISFFAEFIGRSLEILPKESDKKYFLILSEIERQLKRFFNVYDILHPSILHIRKQDENSFIITVNNGKTYSFKIAFEELISNDVVQELLIDHQTGQVVYDDQGIPKFEGVIYQCTVNEPFKVKVSVKKFNHKDEALLFIRMMDGIMLPLIKVSSRGNVDFYEFDLAINKAGMYSYQIVAGDRVDIQTGQIVKERTSHDILLKVDPSWTKAMNLYDSIHTKMVRNPVNLDPKRSGNCTDLKWLVDEKIKKGFNVFKFLPLTQPTRKSPYSVLSPFVLNQDYIDWDVVADNGETIDNKLNDFIASYMDMPTKRHARFDEFAKKNPIQEYAIYTAIRSLVEEGKIDESFKELARKKDMENLLKNEEFKNKYQKNLYIAFVGYEQVTDFIDYTHKKGGRIIIDIPFFRGYDSTDTFFHKEYFRTDDNGNVIAPSWGLPGMPGYQVWGDLAYPDFEKMKSEEYQFYFESFYFWLDDVGVDGFRWDAAHYAPLDAWRVLGERIQGKDIYVLSEQLGGFYEKDYPGKVYGLHVYENIEFNDKKAENFEHFLAWVCKGRDFPMHSSHDSAKIADFSNEHQQYGQFNWHDPRDMQVKAVLTEFAMGVPVFYIQMGDEYLTLRRMHQPGTASEWNDLSPWDPAVKAGDIEEYISKLNKIRSDNQSLQELDNFKIINNNRKLDGVSSFIRTSRHTENAVLVLNNLSGVEHNGELYFDEDKIVVSEKGFYLMDLLTRETIEFKPGENFFPEEGKLMFNLKPGEAKIFDLTTLKEQEEVIINEWLIRNIYKNFFNSEELVIISNLNLFDRVGNDIGKLITLCSQYTFEEIVADLDSAVMEIMDENVSHYTATWNFENNKNKKTLIKDNQWLIVNTAIANYTYCGLQGEDNPLIRNTAIKLGGQYVTLIPPGKADNYWLTFNWHGRDEGTKYHFQVLPSYGNIDETILLEKDFPSERITREELSRIPDDAEVSIGNGKGAICRIPLKGITQGGGYISKYDAELQANLNPLLPEDRKVIIKGSHSTVQIDDNWYDLNESTFWQFERYPFPTWQYKIGEGNDAVIIERKVSMVRGENTTISNYRVLKAAKGKQIKIHVRPHLTNRSFHENTKAGNGLENNWNSRFWNIDLGNNIQGVGFDPVQGGWGENYKGTYVMANKGKFNQSPAWYYNAPHPKETTRGQVDSEDVFSPGYFEIDLKTGEDVDIASSGAVLEDQLPHNRAEFYQSGSVQKTRDSEIKRLQSLFENIPIESCKKDALFKKLLIATDLFVVDREDHKTVIAGYPWFTDWGRDTFIVVLGMIKGGMLEAVKDIILQFGKFEENGTLPNIIHGETAGNRDTVDAPVWYFEIVKQYILVAGEDSILKETVDGSRTVHDILRSIAHNYQKGTPNGIQMDMRSGLIYAPPHYTWMDTNYPAGTPRQGYPIEIQALWHNALVFLTEIETNSVVQSQYRDLAELVQNSFNQLYWNGEYLLDNLRAFSSQTSAFDAEEDYAFRSNQSIPILFGVLDKEKAQKVVKKMYKELVVPRGMRSLSEHSQSIDEHGWYKGHYEGDEDTQRKTAYHNGTAWSFPLAQFMMAYAAAFDYSQDSIKEMLILFETVKEHLREGGIGNISEVMDGNYPHTTRGCDEQAWGASEFLRALAILKYEYLSGYQVVTRAFQQLKESESNIFQNWENVLSSLAKNARIKYFIEVTLADDKKVVLEIPYSGDKQYDVDILATYVQLFLKEHKFASSLLNVSINVRLGNESDKNMSLDILNLLRDNMPDVDNLVSGNQLIRTSA